MSERAAWEQLADAEVAYIKARGNLFEADAEAQLRLALASPTGRGTALRVLRDSPAELVMALIKPLFASASSTHAQVGLAREVMARLDTGWLSKALGPLVNEALAYDGFDWSDYRRLAELLSELGQRELLAEVVSQAQASADNDVREVADDFRTR